MTHRRQPPHLLPLGPALPPPSPSLPSRPDLIISSSAVSPPLVLSFPFCHRRASVPIRLVFRSTTILGQDNRSPATAAAVLPPVSVCLRPYLSPNPDPSSHLLSPPISCSSTASPPFAVRRLPPDLSAIHRDSSSSRFLCEFTPSLAFPLAPAPPDPDSISAVVVSPSRHSHRLVPLRSSAIRPDLQPTTSVHADFGSAILSAIDVATDALLLYCRTHSDPQVPSPPRSDLHSRRSCIDPPPLAAASSPFRSLFSTEMPPSITVVFSRSPASPHRRLLIDSSLQLIDGSTH